MQYRILSIHRETENAASFVLQPLQQSVSYEAGQFITFIFKNRNREEERRSYSISSSSILNEPLMITVKRVVNGAYSRKLLDTAAVGDVLTGLAPTGFFTLPAQTDSKSNFIFFAAGSGITPVYAMIKTLLSRSQNNTVVLVYSNQSKNETIFYNELQLLEQKYAVQFHIHFLFSDALHYSKARLSSLMVEDIIRQYCQDSLESLWVYLCGPFQYMLMITLVAKGMGIQEERIRKENFVIHASTPLLRPPDTEPHTVLAKLNGVEYSWKVRYPETILAAAKKQGIDLPYNCESGQCGACAAKCIKGKVWMYKNDVLMDHELEMGHILTCTGYPVAGDVEISY
ncbi:flavin reductase family protein [Sediminibacterium goheungense]|uniref:Ring-1,2-phenylacetyl-CoA epoxidase subunit PaaE n=1 Tax=Sediminibacterium goheungense TaxID=1086393 RepID=A0A4R6J044_9BACT|nr:iron-sulfur cluster-binding domain-containing protein [Sediminibacterium goheungense]TDO28542.1 ring-1,2-phenylacetyl-CoA epoxidase subunit PaaE [Sediminibacterium goheungense]